MRILFFGIYNPNYSRTRILMKGLRAHGAEIDECRVDPREYGRFAKFWHLYTRAKRMRAEKRYDHILVAYPGHSVVWLAVLLFGKRRVVFDAFISLYNANIYDRRKHHPLHPLSWRDWFLDRWSARLAGHVILHTLTQARFYRERLGIDREFINVYIGADDEVVRPMPKQKTPPLIESGRCSEDAWKVHFHGNFMPVQGIEHIIGAAEILRDEPIHTIIVGGGDSLEKYRKYVKDNGLEQCISLTGRVEFGEVPYFIASADICLGIFGDTPKAGIVVPNKIFECAAMAKPIITADTEAVKELFADGENISLVPAANAAALAEGIRRLIKDAHLRNRIARNVYKVFREKCMPEKVVEPLIKTLEQYER